MASTYSTFSDNSTGSSARDAFDVARIFKRRGRAWDTAARFPLTTLLKCGNASDASRVIGRELNRVAAKAVIDEDWLLSIPPTCSEGFAIDVCRSDGGIRGFFGELEQEFDTVDDALIWVGRALSSDYRLRTVLRGQRPMERHLEPAQEGCGPSLSAGYLSFIAWFRARSTVIRANNLGRE